MSSSVNHADRLAHEQVVVRGRVAALARQLAEIVEAQALTSHDDEHDPEGATIAFERASVQGLLAGARRELVELARAVARLEAGTYGRCVRCGDPISPDRLDALPATGTCIACTGRR